MPYRFWQVVLDHITPELQSRATGSTFTAINSEHLQASIVPLPPLAEQKRIVAKVDTAMKLLDEVEAHRTAALQKLDELEKAILTLAVSGKLASQDPKEGTAEELYTLIQAERAKAAASSTGRKKKSKALPPIDSKEVPFEIPKSWKWVRGEEFFRLIRGVTYGKSDSRRTPESDFVPLLRAHNIQDVGINTDELVFVHKPLVAEEQMVRRGDILIAMSSGSSKLVGKAAQAAADMDYCFGAFCAVARPWVSAYSLFLAFIFSTPYYRSFVASEGKGIGINNLTTGALTNFPIPLPPLAEQKRIVAKVDAAMRQIQDMRSSLT